MDTLDRKLNDIFPGKVVRKDLVHQIKRAANVPSFVLEFLFPSTAPLTIRKRLKRAKKRF